MTAWRSDELSSIEGADELDLASVRRDGTLRNPVTIWVVRHGDDLYEGLARPSVIPEMGVERTPRT